MIFDFFPYYFLQWWFDIRVAAKVVSLWVGGLAMSIFFTFLLFAVVAAQVVGRPFPGACQIPKNGSQFPTRPLTLLPQIGHFVLCYTFYEMKQGAMRSLFPLNWRVPLEKTSHSLFNLFYLFLSNHWPSINSISLCSTEDIWRQRDTAQCNSVRKRFLSFFHLS